MRTYDRRQLLQAGGAWTCGIVLASCGESNVSGGEDEAASRVLWATNEAYSRPDMIGRFEDETGIKVELEIFSDVTEIASKLRTGGTGIAGFVDGSYHAPDAYKQDLLQPVDLSNVPNYDANVIEDFKNAAGHVFDGEVYGIPTIWGTDSMAYNNDEVGGTLDNLEALWDPQFEGKIAMPAGLHESVIVAGIYAGADDPFDMSDEELDEARKLLLDQKPLVRTYWKEIGELTNLFATGEVYVGWAWVPVLELREKADIDMVWAVPKQGQLGWYDANYISKEASPSEKAAFEQLANYLIGDFYGVQLADQVDYRTTSTAAIEHIPENTRKELDLNDPSAFLNNATYWTPPTRPGAYEAVMNDVLSA